MIAMIIQLRGNFSVFISGFYCMECNFYLIECLGWKEREKGEKEKGLVKEQVHEKQNCFSQCLISASF